MDQDFVGKTALVTGAGAGIGRELCRKLISIGAKVIAVSRSESRLKDLEEELKSDRLEIVCVDLADWKATDAKLRKTCETVDYLVNNAGYSHNCLVDEVTEDELDKTLNINLKAPMNLIKLVAKGMKERRFGSIVNVSSVAGVAALDEHVEYAASKAALDMVTKIGAKELGGYNVRVNSVNPTVVWTAMGRDHWSDPDRLQTMTSKIPLARFVEIREVIDPIVFLLGSKSSMINGIMLPIDGGFLAT